MSPGQGIWDRTPRTVGTVTVAGHHYRKETTGLPKLGRTGELGHYKWDRKTLTVKPWQDSQGTLDWTGQRGQVSPDKSAGQGSRVTSAWTRQRGEDGPDITARTGQLGLDNRERILGQNNCGRTARTGQWGHVSLDRLVRKLGWTGQTGQRGQGSHNMIVKTWQQGLAIQDRTAGTEQIDRTVRKW